MSSMERMAGITRQILPISTQPSGPAGTAAAANAPEAFSDVLTQAVQHLAQGQAPATPEEALQMARLIQAQVQMEAMSLAASDPDSGDDGSGLFPGLAGMPGLSGLSGLPDLLGLLGKSGVRSAAYAAAPVAAAQPAGPEAQARFAALKPAFQQAEKVTGVPWQIQAAQWALETGWGQFTPSDIESGRESFNLFGIKGEGPAGSVIAMTTEFIGGRMIQQPAAFRAYNSYEEAVIDHARLLTTARYAPARAAGKDLKAWATALQQLGYATDPDYADKLWQIISANGWDKP